MDIPSDARPQREAAKLIGRSYETIRRWRREGRLRGYRDPSGMVLVSLAEVTRVAGLTGAAALARKAPEDSARADIDTRLRRAEMNVDDARAERDRAWAQVEQLTRLVGELRGDLARQAERVTDLEKRGEGQVRGLLAETTETMRMLIESERRVFELERNERKRG